jgi:NAD(P) transhydrogenase subunit beta
MKGASEAGAMRPDALSMIGVSALIGCVTFSGSIVAAGKLHGAISGKPVKIPFLLAINAGALGVAIVGVIALASTGGAWWALGLVILLALGLGVTLTLPIGGADMPVMVSLLNSYSGLAAAAAGFVVDYNKALIVSGALVGASGLILTAIMCKAMNRSLANVLFAGVGTADSTGAAGVSVEGKTVKSADAEDCAIVLDAAQRMLIVPGYGMAVAQAQHAVRELADLLQERGVTVMYGVHPVAGRMPGHMNVLLAEADVPYEQLLDLDQANAEIDTCDVAMVIGANDVVNPSARHDQSSPIYGMPIIDVDKAGTCFVLKRSLGAGYAGVENELFFGDRTLMVFGDAKDTLQKVMSALKNL